MNFQVKEPWGIGDYVRVKLTETADLSFSLWSELEFAKLIKGKSDHQITLHYLSVVTYLGQR